MLDLAVFRMDEPIDPRELRYAEDHILMLLNVLSTAGPHMRTRESVSGELWPHIAEQAIRNLLAKGLIVEKDGALEIAVTG